MIFLVLFYFFCIYNTNSQVRLGFGCHLALNIKVTITKLLILSMGHSLTILLVSKRFLMENSLKMLSTSTMLKN